jgi:hypothetical protein
MMKYNHSSGIWRVEVHNKHTSIEADYFTVTNDVSNEDAERIVACVNALKDIKNPEYVPKALEAMKRLITALPITGNSIAVEYAMNDVCRALAELSEKK